MPYWAGYYQVCHLSFLKEMVLSYVCKDDPVMMKDVISFLPPFCDRLLHGSHDGSEDGPGGAGRAGEGEGTRRVAADAAAQRHVVPGGVPLVHLPFHRHPASGGGKSIKYGGHSIRLYVLKY